MTINELIEAFLLYDMGEVKFVEHMLKAGASRRQINECLLERRADDEEF
jgi:hypothetical protein